MQEMVNWPGPFDSYHDSGEGGLFAWMVVPEATSDGEDLAPNVAGYNCHVDVEAYLSRPRVALRAPDVCISADRVKVYEPHDYKNGWITRSMELDRLIQQQPGDHRELRRAVIQSLGSDDLSVPMLAAVFLGSTCHSLWDERMSSYFEVTPDSLTEGGKALYNGFQAAYGVDPMILTFLDT
jgi:hypothetical protein